MYQIVYDTTVVGSSHTDLTLICACDKFRLYLRKIDETQLHRVEGRGKHDRK